MGHVRTILSLDPGTLNTGWAVWERVKESDVDDGWLLCASGTWVRPSDVPHGSAFNWMLAQLVEQIVNGPLLDELWVEMFYPFKERPTKNTFPLTLLVGGYLGAGVAAGLHTVGVEPGVWKGWVKKEGVHYPDVARTDHEADAIMIGRYAKEFPHHA